MIVDIEQQPNKQQLLISYVNNKKNISFYKIPLPDNQYYVWNYAGSEKTAHTQYKSWDNKFVKKVPSKKLNRFRLQELLLDIGETKLSALYENNIPQSYACDIETDILDDGFVDPNVANAPVNTISWVSYPDCFVFGRKGMSSQDVITIENEINDYIKPLNIKYNFYYIQHTDEISMLKDFFYNYFAKAPMVTGWNLFGYDITYLWKRAELLGIDLKPLSPNNQWKRISYEDKVKGKTFLQIPRHKVILDLMLTYKKWDMTVDVKENDTLDFVAETVLGLTKLKYKGTLKELYVDNYKDYVKYNGIDSILVEQINNKIKTNEVCLSLANLTRVEVYDAFSPVAMFESTLARYGYKEKKVFPQKYKDDVGQRDDYEGAFVYEPTPGLYPWTVSYDFASLYPSVMRQFGISIENFVEKNKDRPLADDEIRLVSGAIFKRGDYLVPKILTDYYGQRKSAKKLSVQAEHEIAELKEILKGRKQNIL